MDIMSNIFPTNYTDKWSASASDKVWASDTVTNFNITVDEIGDRNFFDRTTSNLLEWSNLYYTDTRVANAPAVSAIESDISDIQSDKADKTNVLELNNTTPYTPTADYHPATKKWVEDQPYPQASTTTEGIIEQATTAEYITKTDTSKAPRIVDIWTYMPRTPWTTSSHISNAAYPSTSYSTNSNTFTTVDSFVATTWGVYRVIFDIQWTGWNSAFHQILVNGNVQAEVTTSWSLIQDNIFHITVGRWDTVEIQLRTQNTSFPATLYWYNITSD